jgi:hypothetical protein
MITAKINGVTNLSANFINSAESESKGAYIPPTLFLKISQSDYDGRPIQRELLLQLYASNPAVGDLLHDIFLAIDGVVTAHQRNNRDAQV